MTTGTDGVLHGMATKVIQTAEGDPAPVHSIASGLDYPGSPHAFLAGDGAWVTYVSATDAECLDAFQLLVPHRGHHPGAGEPARGGARHGAKADDAEGRDRAGQPVGSRRQGRGLRRGRFWRRGSGTRVLLTRG